MTNELFPLDLGTARWLQKFQLREPRLPVNTQIWLALLDRADCDVPNLQRWLAADELERAGRFVVEPPRTRFIVSHAALRIVLASATGLHPSELQFVYSPKGKPSLDPRMKSGGELRFSLAHSNDVALIALSTTCEVGIDVERICERPDAEKIASTFFALNEQAALHRAAPPDRPVVFHRLWTRKEAVLKASGQGITSGLRTPDVSPGLSEGVLSVEFNGAWWVIYDLNPTRGYAGAIALEAGQAARTADS